ncbi:hypothetical protein CSPX01_14120 [Colletotrichum filicis]|nr:hypothetical protein CSPX01_14120 [Colletotrichum filicis]
MIVASLRLRTRTLEGGTDLLNPAMLQATQQLVIINFYDRAIRSSHPITGLGTLSLPTALAAAPEPASGTSPRIPCSPSLVDVRPLHCRFAADLLCVTKLRVNEGRKSVLESMRPSTLFDTHSVAISLVLVAVARLRQDLAASDADSTLSVRRGRLAALSAEKGS